MLALVFDTETTGLVKHPSAKMSVQPKIIEFGAALVDEEGRVVDEMNLIIDPQEPIEPIITKITGLTDDDLRGKPTFADVAPQIAALFSRADAMIAHNLPFDSTLIELELKRNNIEEWPWPPIQICTVQEHAEEWGRRPKLEELYQHAKGEPANQTHRALGDVYLLVEVCKIQGVLHDISSTSRSD